MILRWSDSQFWLRGLIFCPGLLLNRSGLEFWLYSDFSVHMVFMCRFCKPECSAAFLFEKLAPRWGDSYYTIVSTSGFDVLIECTDFMHVRKHFPKIKNIIFFGPLGALGRLLQLARSCHRITLIEPYPLSSTSHYYLPEVAHLNDLLRQQSENVFWSSKNRWTQQFWAVFSDFLIF